jgi:hypothetical protein
MNTGFRVSFVHCKATTWTSVLDWNPEPFPNQSSFQIQGRQQVGEAIDKTSIHISDNEIWLDWDGDFVEP